MAYAEISAALSSIKAASDIAKLIKESVKSLEQAETNFKLAELTDALVDVKSQVADVKSILLEKDEEIRLLKEQINLKQTLEYEAPYYWQIIEGEKQGPYCQGCYDNSTKLIRLQGSDNGDWSCRICKCSFKDKNYRAPTIPRRNPSPPW